MHTLGAGLAGFILLRFLMGLAECGNYTAGIKALAGLFPAATRSRAGGFFNAGAQFGSVIAPPLILVFLPAPSASAGNGGFVIPALLGSAVAACRGWRPSRQGADDGDRAQAGRRDDAAAPGDLGLGQLHCRNQQGARAVPDPRLHRPDHHVLLDVAAAVSPHRAAGMSFLAVGIFAVGART